MQALSQSLDRFTERSKQGDAGSRGQDTAAEDDANNLRALLAIRTRWRVETYEGVRNHWGNEKILGVNAIVAVANRNLIFDLELLGFRFIYYCWTKKLVRTVVTKMKFNGGSLSWVKNTKTIFWASSTNVSGKAYFVCLMTLCATVILAKLQKCCASRHQFTFSSRKTLCALLTPKNSTKSINTICLSRHAFWSTALQNN